ncbi:TIGR01244 family sulfur transferase [Methylobacterium organophilum]|uniref:TIGR01244 family sulfur transferase n=1 Tax=Methylobacterium organophilum TaxID=410 RepID=UPI001F13CED0|nr:TIGR01244 family sulfur transferase [Methylobacterium organophilum]UMY15960.1 TIGR01244 family sulfur transferase [Methylobacterium organophilum]
MTRRIIDEKLSVGGQPSLAEIAALGGEGVTLLINNRPDGETPGQPGGAAERAAAEGAGLAYLDLPVTRETITRAAIERFHAAVTGAPGPVFAHCAGGTRSLTLWVLGEVLAGKLRREDIPAYAARHGYDLSGALRWLEANDAVGGPR